MKVTPERLKEIANILPCVKSRLPYTYHHDAVRLFIQQKTGEMPSRSDIASLHSTDEELYTIAIYQILEDMKPLDLLEIPAEYAKELKEIYQNALVFILQFFEKNYELKYARK